MKNTITAQEIIEILQNYVKNNIKSWVNDEVLNELNRGGYDLTHTGFSFSRLPVLNAYLNQELPSNGKVSYNVSIDNMRAEGLNNVEISSLFAGWWMEEYSNLMESGINKSLKPAHSLLYLNYTYISSLSTDLLLEGLLNISTTNNSLVGSSLKDATEVNVYDRKWISIRNQPISSKHNMRLSRKFSTACHDALLILKQNGVLLLPPGFKMRPGGDSTSTRFISKIILDSSVKKRANRSGYIFRMYASSTVENIEDIPDNLREVFDINSDINLCGTLSFLASDLILYSKKNNKTPFPVERLRLDKTSNAKKGSLEWCKINLSPPWFDFANAYYDMDTNAGRQSKATSLTALLDWALDRRNFNSPWDILATDLRDPYLKTNLTFFDYIKGKDIKYKWVKWNSGDNIFAAVVNNSKFSGSVFYKHNVLNPFDLHTNPFPSHNKGKRNKTHRSRIQQTIIEVMINTLLSPDEDGKPTFDWAKKFNSDYTYIPDKDNPLGNSIRVWCPSRACCLATLLLMPIRGFQARWLDQGLMDQMTYDPSTGLMVKNTHKLHKWRYSNGESHLKRYGRPTGVLQSYHDPIMKTEDISIFINTNKTQVWDGSKKTGYDIPWPDGSIFLKSENSELKAQGRWLKRIYDVLNFQLSWLQQNDPDPKPVNFSHINEDKGKIADNDDCINELPWFVPIFRSFSTQSTVTYEQQGNIVNAHGPVSKGLLVAMFNALAIETEKKLNANGIRVTITKPNMKGVTEKTVDTHGIETSERRSCICTGIAVGLPAECGRHGPDSAHIAPLRSDCLSQRTAVPQGSSVQESVEKP